MLKKNEPTKPIANWTSRNDWNWLAASHANDDPSAAITIILRDPSQERINGESKELTHEPIVVRTNKNDAEVIFTLV